MLNIYRESFENETVFFNKLEIIKRSRRQTNAWEEDQWILSSTREPHSREGDGETNRPERPKYNFLQDEKRREGVMQ